MRGYIREQLRKIAESYNGDHDLGPDAPVTWREKALLDAVNDLAEEIERLKKEIADILDTATTAAEKDFLE